MKKLILIVLLVGVSASANEVYFHIDQGSVPCYYATNSNNIYRHTVNNQNPYLGETEKEANEIVRIRALVTLTDKFQPIDKRCAEYDRINIVMTDALLLNSHDVRFADNLIDKIRQQPVVYLSTSQKYVEPHAGSVVTSSGYSSKHGHYGSSRSTHEADIKFKYFNEHDAIAKQIE